MRLAADATKHFNLISKQVTTPTLQTDQSSNLTTGSSASLTINPAVSSARFKNRGSILNEGILSVTNITNKSTINKGQITYQGSGLCSFTQ